MCILCVWRADNDTAERDCVRGCDALAVPRKEHAGWRGAGSADRYQDLPVPGAHGHAGSTGHVAAAAASPVGRTVD